MKIYCRQTDWCKEVYEVDEKDFVVEKECELDEFGKVLKRGFLGHYQEFEKKEHLTYFAVCPNCKSRTEIKDEWGKVVGSGRVYYGD